MNVLWSFENRAKQMLLSVVLLGYANSVWVFYYSLHQDKRESKEAPFSPYTLRSTTSKRKILLAIFSFDGGVAIFFHQFHGIDEITHVFG